MISWIAVVVVLVAAQRVAELVYARRNTARLLAAGAREVGARHYPVIVAVHVAWLAALVVSVPADTVPSLPWLAVFVALQAAVFRFEVAQDPDKQCALFAVENAPPDNDVQECRRELDLKRNPPVMTCRLHVGLAACFSRRSRVVSTRVPSDVSVSSRSGTPGGNGASMRTGTAG